MQSIRWPRVLFGGVLVGCLVFVLESITSLVYAQERTHALAAHDLGPLPGPWGAVLTAVSCFGLGCGTVWLYAAIQPRFGAGIKTALIAGVAVWALWFVPSLLRWFALGLMVPWVLGYSLAVALAESIAAAFIGAWIYPDRSSPAPERASG